MSTFVIVLCILIWLQTYHEVIKRHTETLPALWYRLIIILAHSDTGQTPCTAFETIRTIQRRPCKIYQHSCKKGHYSCKNLLFVLQNWTKIHIKNTQNYIDSQRSWSATYQIYKKSFFEYASMVTDTEKLKPPGCLSRRCWSLLFLEFLKNIC